MLRAANEDVGDAGWTGRQRLVQVAFIWGVWTLVGVFFASQVYVYFSRTKNPMSFTRALMSQMLAVYLFALLTPVVLWLARRYRLGRTDWQRSVLAHAAGGTLVASVWAAGHVILDITFSSGTMRVTVANVARGAFFQIDKELLVYWIIVLISHAASYYRRYREGELRASQAQLQALKMQLHPHFLFNALHSVSSLIHRDPEAADRMLSRLGDFLRMTLENSATQVVGLRQELEFLNCYLEIERIRFSDRLTTELKVDPQALDCQVPNLILQPIVENAIRHGVAPRSQAGRVEVAAERRGDVLRLRVTDNGPGMSASAHAPQTKTHKGGYGLSNTRARLEHLYGPSYRFEMSDAPGGGLLVTLEIPARSIRDERPDERPRPELSAEKFSAALGR